MKSKPSVCGPTAAFIFFDRKENEAKETLFYFFRKIFYDISMVESYE